MGWWWLRQICDGGGGGGGCVESELQVMRGVVVSVGCLEADCDLRLIYLCFHSTGAPSILARGAAFWILMGRSLLIQDRELESSGIFMGWVDGLLWWSGGCVVSF
ncbi:hypothetical protein L195_g047047 [Trifolium pratense]|uniref:Uncharacterized protein n=1 Tax=Trifolium pratense TaxID=57577 RepID=A0A2K3MJK0_TRIPR|nr:hypothetical protein L195_g047047 [Trifolium pratense]